jgi:hypothetical protein
MDQLDAVTAEAKRVYDRDEEALLVSIGQRELAVQENRTDLPIEGDFAYATTTMGIDDLKKLGLRILRRWNKALHEIVCPAAGADGKDREALLKALNISDVAAIGVVTGLLLPLGVPAPVAAPLAALIVKKFLAPAGAELCDAWGEAINAQE